MNLVSLMDIFTILVFFLLVNSTSSDVMEPPKSISLPASFVESKPRETVVVMVTEEEVLAESQRCMSCGMCMDCETCWMYCTNSAFERLPKGEHYRVKLEVCNGCKKCADACPCGFIDMK